MKENENVSKEENLNTNPVEESSKEENVAKVEKPTTTKDAKVKKDPNKKSKVKKTGEKENWFLKIAKEEHRWETYLLGFISCVALGIGSLILTDVLVFKEDTPVLSDYSTAVGWVFIVFGIIGFLLFIIPIFKPTRSEVKQLSLPSRKLFFTNVLRVFVFITVLALVFMLYDSAISGILGWIL